MAAGVSAPPLISGEGNTYDFYVGDQEEYDSNLYRLPPGQSAITAVSPNASRDDILSIVSAGGDAQWSTGRQVVDVDLHVDTTRFAHNSVLDNTGGYAKLLWDWQLGPYLSGTAGANWTRGLVSFGEALYLGKDLVDSPDYYGTARYQIGPHLAVYGSVNDSSISHSLPIAHSQDFKTKAGSAGLEFDLATSTTLSAEYRYATGEYPGNGLFTLNGVTFNQDYHDNTFLFLLNHTFSDKTQVVADAGYLKRDYPGTIIGSFSGDVWRVTFNWQPTDKTQVAFAAWHELHAYLEAESNYFVSKGGSIRPVWNATDKISVAMVLSYEHQDFIPASTSVVATGPLNAELSTERLDVTYAPRSNWLLGLSFAHTNRGSNADYYRFGDDLANLTVLYKIH